MEGLLLKCFLLVFFFVSLVLFFLNETFLHVKNICIVLPSLQLLNISVGVNPLLVEDGHVNKRDPILAWLLNDNVMEEVHSVL